MSDDSVDLFQSAYCAERLKALSDPLRLRIISLLRNGEVSVGDIAAVLETEIATVSHHLQILKNARLVATRRDGRFIYYALCEDVQCSTSSSTQSLNLGCCTIVVP